MKATPLLDNTFWVLEDNGKRVGTIQRGEDGITVTIGSKPSLFSSLTALESEFKIDFIAESESPQADNVLGYPAKATFNPAWDLSLKVPVFTQEQRSSSMFAAGWYKVFLKNTWVTTFCPKILTIKRNKFHGPFKTKEDADEHPTHS